MLIFKRLAIWIPERLIEGCLLGGLFGYLLLRSSTDISPTVRDWLSGFWRFGVVVAVFLFLHGYYVTTALFGVVWRSAKIWLYPTITSALFVLHTHITFMRAGSDFSPEARAMEFPFALGGAGIVFCCSLVGNFVLSRWRNVHSNTNPYLSTLGITLLVFTIANIAHFLRPVMGDSAFKRYGLPFIFYRDGGFIKEWVWQPGEFIWRGMVADAAVVAAVVLLVGKAWQTVRAQ